MSNTTPGGETKMCQHEGTNHSDDRVTVYHGTPEPRVLCGYHAQVEGWGL